MECELRVFDSAIGVARAYWSAIYERSMEFIWPDVYQQNRYNPATNEINLV
jgi:hypothetical protein